jgi:hypothetical protein
MPGLDQTGPMGYGPRTGRGMGPCGRGMAYRGRFPRGYGAGFGGGFGRGRCFFWNYPVYPVEPVPLSKEAEKELLGAELKRLEAEKADIQRRLEEIG